MTEGESKKEVPFSEMLHRYREQEGLRIAFPDDWLLHPEKIDPVTILADAEEAGIFVGAHLEWALMHRVAAGEPPFPLPENYVTQLEVHRISIVGQGRHEVTKSMTPAPIVGGGETEAPQRTWWQKIRHPFGGG
jgi:hypothetical protein